MGKGHKHLQHIVCACMLLIRCIVNWLFWWLTLTFRRGKSLQVAFALCICNQCVSHLSSLFVTFINTNATRANWLAFHRIKWFSSDCLFTILHLKMDFFCKLENEKWLKSNDQNAFHHAFSVGTPYYDDQKEKFFVYIKRNWNRESTYSANEAIGMPLCVQSWDVVFHNGAIAASTFWCEHVEVIVAAVWFAIAFMESFFAELLAALGTEEMLCVPSFIQSSYTFLWIRRKESHQIKSLFASSNPVQRTSKMAPLQ